MISILITVLLILLESLLVLYYAKDYWHVKTLLFIRTNFWKRVWIFLKLTVPSLILLLTINALFDFFTQTPLLFINVIRMVLFYLFSSLIPFISKKENVVLWVVVCMDLGLRLMLVF